MRTDPLVEESWTLVAPDEADVGELMSWFPDARSIEVWGGTGFRYPFTHESFLADCRIEEMVSYCLRDPEGTMVAFGQVYDRHDRRHLARLITHPKMRRQGIGKRLIAMLIKAARLSCGNTEYSLFVYRDNEPAYCCYLEMGFVLQDYPEDAPMQGKCYFMTRTIDAEEAQPT